VDLVERKRCTYDCVYCQIGVRSERTCERRDPFGPERVLAEVTEALASGPRPDVITLAGSGEPTLYGSLPAVVSGLRSLTDVPLALITNGSLLHLGPVADVAAEMDIVVPSLDAGDALTFERVNRPHPDISFETMVAGLQRFSRRYTGSLRLEIMLVGGVNDSVEQIEAIARLAEGVQAAWIELNTPVRPSGVEGSQPPAAERLSRAQELLGPRARLVGPFARTEAARVVRGELYQTVLATLSRRPCTLNDLRHALGRTDHELAKVLGAALAAGAVTERRGDAQVYYQAGGPPPAGRAAPATAATRAERGDQHDRKR